MVVQINLLHLDMAHAKPRAGFHGGTRILVCRQVPGHPTSGMHGLDFMPYQVCTMLSGEVQCKNTLYCCHQMSAKHQPFWHLGEFPQCSLYGGSWDGGGVDQRLFGLSTTAPLENNFQRIISLGTQGVCSSLSQQTMFTDTAKGNNNTSPGAQCSKWN